MTEEEVDIIAEQRTMINSLRQDIVDLKAENKILRDLLTTKEVQIMDNEVPKSTRISDI